MTTADPFMSEALAEQLREKEMEMLDATISGGPKMIHTKEITLMVGGKEPVFQSCESIFDALSKQVFYVGKNGSGALMKLMVNLVGGLSRMVLAEALALSKKAGLDQHRLLEVLKSSSHFSKAMETKGLSMVEENFTPPKGKLAFHLKDVRLMLDLGKRFDFPLPLSSLHAQALTSLVSKGRGEWDNTAIISFYKDLASL
jgi:3-hydroxyisobutyrate dehydrogenase-like beta-hydroxyacid dehydrogenase